jgi:acetyltransferase-like isoleucine patch superfamily enzyme
MILFRATAKAADRVLRLLLPGDVYARRIGVRVGEDCRILSREFGSEPFLIEIGDRVTISSNVNFVTHDGAGWLVQDERGRRYLYGRIRIGNDVFVGAGATLLPGVEIGDRAIVGAGSVVTKSVPTGAVVGGNPARMLTSYAAFHDRALRQWAAEADMRGTRSYAERVQQALGPAKPLMTPDGDERRGRGKAAADGSAESV